jgi:intracellular sulfur oxidation DsrE/DsrF family protein
MFSKKFFNKRGPCVSMKRSLRKLLPWFVALLVCTSAWSSDVATVLAGKEAPAGVVFEIVGGDRGELGGLLLSVTRDIEKLRQRFPDLPIAVVTHGYEQFDLLSENRTTAAQAHNLVTELVNTNEIEVHVCGTHAEWQGKTPEDFPDYVNVSAAGPAQINDYVSMGYELIVLP